MLVVLGTILLAQTANGVPSVRRVQGLHSRSLPDIPAACQAICAPFAPFLAGASCPVTDCCVAIFETGYFECFMCVGNATHATDYTLAQEYVDVLTTSCLTEGITLQELTFPGQNSDRTLATALPVGASSIPIFATNTPAAPPSSVVGHPTASSSSAHTITPSQSAIISGLSTGASAISGSASAPISGSSGSVSGASQSSALSGSATAPASQSTVTSPPSSSGSGSAPAPTSSAPSNAAPRSRSRTPVEAVVALCAAIALLQALLV